MNCLLFIARRTPALPFVCIYTLLFFYLSIDVSAQNNTTTPDTIVIKPTAPTDTSLAKQDTLKPKLSRQKNAQRAALWSLLPGAGAAYNKQYYKVPIYAGGVAGLGTLTIQQYAQYRKYYNQHTQVLKNQALGITDNTDLTPIREKKQGALRNYNLFFNATLALYTFSIAESYATNLLHSEAPKEHSPFRAAYRSAILPGWGQAYNRKVWKIPVIYGGFGALGYSIYYNGSQSNRYKQEYLARTRPGYGTTDDRLAPITPDNLLKIRSQYKRYYDLSIIIGTLWYVINVADATIDAHLYKFDTSDDLSQLHIYPIIQTNPITLQSGGGVGLCWNF